MLRSSSKVAGGQGHIAHRHSVPAVTRLSRSAPSLLQPTLVQEAKHARRGIILGAGPAANASTMSDGWWKKDNPPNMKDVGSIQELVDELADAGDKLVIVEFYAPWCNACKALFPKLCRMMAEHQEDVLFVKVSFEANKEMCKTMGVKVLPYFHFYRGAEGRVDAFSCTVSKIQRMKDAIENYTAAFCSLEPAPGVAEFPEIHPHPELEAAGAGPNDQPTNLDRIGAWR